MRHPVNTLALISLLIIASATGLSATAQTAAEPAATAPAAQGGARPSRDSLHCTHPGNCVSSVGQWAVPPLEAFGTAPQAREALLRALAASPEARIVREEPLYVDVIFTTTLGFKDQVEFIIDPQGRRIDFRSRSQVGLWDIGMNRRRIGALRARFEQMQGR
jgi:uncharacterized protein (DUF1499 family)